MPRSPSARSSTRLRRVKPGRASTAQVTGVVLLSAVVLLGGVMLYLWPQMSLVELGYRQNALRAQRDRAARRRNELQVERAMLSRLERIEALALQRLGMRPPKLAQVIYVKPESSAAQAGSMP